MHIVIGIECDHRAIYSSNGLNGFASMNIVHMRARLQNNGRLVNYQLHDKRDCDL